MKRAVLRLALLILPAALGAQDTSRTFRYDGNGAVFFSAGACQHRYLNVGVGMAGEGFIWRGLTLGGEAGYYRFPADRSAGYGVLMFGPGYHFVNRNKHAKLDPFLKVGIIGAALGSKRVAGAGGFGAGLNYWFRERIGLQTGFQLQVLSAEEVIGAFRIGLTFR